MDTIGERKQFYGYIIGLQVERSPTDEIGFGLYATFESGEKAVVWKVQDPDLFRILAHHLSNMAIWRAEHRDYGYEKLYISKEGGKWIVEVP